MKLSRPAIICYNLHIANFAGVEVTKFYTDPEGGVSACGLTYHKDPAEVLRLLDLFLERNRQAVMKVGRNNDGDPHITMRFPGGEVTAVGDTFVGARYILLGELAQLLCGLTGAPVAMFVG